jgi:hypothetical protein
LITLAPAAYEPDDVVSLAQIYVRVAIGAGLLGADIIVVVPDDDSVPRENRRGERGEANQ